MPKSKKEIKTVKSKKTAKSIDKKRKIAKRKAINKTSLKNKTNQKFYDQLKLNESYISLILGAFVVIAIAAVILVWVFQTRDEVQTQRVLNSVLTPSPTPVVQTYIMQENESLWSVAVRFYEDGNLYTEIVEANPEVITNPDYVPPGTEIIIPDIN